jgi:hypothetical protein
VGFHSDVAPNSVAIPHFGWSAIVGPRRLRFGRASGQTGNLCGNVFLDRRIRGDGRTFQSGLTYCSLRKYSPVGQHIRACDVLDGSGRIEARTSTDGVIDSKWFTATRISLTNLNHGCRTLAAEVWGPFPDRDF